MKEQTLTACLNYLKNNFKIEDFETDFFYDLEDNQQHGLLITLGKTFGMDEKYCLIDDSERIVYDPNPISGPLISNLGYYLIKEKNNEEEK